MNFFTSTCLHVPCLHCIALHCIALPLHPPAICLHCIQLCATCATHDPKTSTFLNCKLHNQKTSTLLIHRVGCHYCSVQGDFRSRERRKMTSGNKRNVRPWAPSVLCACHCQCREYIDFPPSNERRFEFHKISFGLIPPFLVGRLRN